MNLTMLSSEQIAAYRRLGYLIVENVFSPSEIDELRRVTDAFVEKSRDHSANDAVFDLEPDHTRQQPRVKTIKNTAKLHEAYGRAIAHPKLLDLVADLIGPSIRYSSDKLNLKLGQPGDPAGDPPLRWTQPWAHYPHTNDALLVAGVAIDEATLANGCLQVAPGTHRGPIHDHHRDGRFTGKITEPGFRPENSVALEMKPGAVAVRHIRLVRTAGANHSTLPRRMLVYHYGAGDAWPLMGGAGQWEAYVAGFLRGGPTNRPRLEAIPVRLPVTSSTGA